MSTVLLNSAKYQSYIFLCRVYDVHFSKINMAGVDESQLSAPRLSYSTYLPSVKTNKNEEYRELINETKVVTHMTTGRNGGRQAQQM
jgi:hypothetical protein